jgi:hypothetical protein
MKFSEYSESKHYTIRPDVLEYDKLERPVFDLIIGVKTMKRLGIILDFQTNIIQIDHISLPMRDIFKLQENLKSKKLGLGAWAVNNSIMRNEPDSTRELTDRAIKILDAKYEKADLPEIVNTQCQHLAAERTTNSSNRI